MRLQMEVRRLGGGQFIGSVQRPEDPAGVEFWGVLELVAALEQLMGPEPAAPGLGAQLDPREGR